MDAFFWKGRGLVSIKISQSHYRKNGKSVDIRTAHTIHSSYPRWGWFEENVAQCAMRILFTFQVCKSANLWCFLGGGSFVQDVLKYILYIINLLIIYNIYFKNLILTKMLNSFSQTNRPLPLLVLLLSLFLIPWPQSPSPLTSFFWQCNRNIIPNFLNLFYFQPHHLSRNPSLPKHPLRVFRTDLQTCRHWKSQLIALWSSFPPLYSLPLPLFNLPYFFPSPFYFWFIIYFLCSPILMDWLLLS